MYEPGQNLSPVELQHFYFGVTVNFSIDELFLDAFDVTIHDSQFLVEINEESAFLECQ